MGGLKLVVVATLMVMAGTMVTADGKCYTYYDHAAKYHLDHVANTYPWDEVKLAMSQSPMLSQVFAESTVVPTSRPPDGHYYSPVSEVCPSHRFMLKAFKVDGKQCYVIKPEIQQVRYARCNNQYNRDCHYCNQGKGGLSKCEENYEWQMVWAYCKPIIVVHPKPHPVPHPIPHPLPRPPVLPRPKLQTYPNIRPYVQPRPVRPKPVLPKPLPVPHPVPHPKPHPVPHPVPHPQPHPVPHPQPHPVPHPEPHPPTVYHATKIYAKPTYYYDPYRGGQTGRWKRAVPPHFPGKLEQIALYLPYMCGCKTYHC